MFPLGDFITGGFSIINKLIAEHKLEERMKLLFGFGLSWFVTSTGAAGAALMAHQPFAIAIGLGLTSGAGCLIFLARSNPRTKGIMFAYTTDIPVDMTQFKTEEKK